jgi:hypothetical protein
MAPTQVLCQPPPPLLSLVPQKLDWHVGNANHIRMATIPSLGQPRQTWSMNDLSSELLALIFEQASETDTGVLSSVLVSTIYINL